MLFVQFEGSDKGGLQLCQEMQGTAQESDMAPNGLAAGQAADGLVDDRLKNGGGQILPGGTVIDQRLDVGFGEYAAAGRDRIQGLVILRVLVQAGRVRLQEGSHLVDEGPCTARADTVHALLDITVFKIDDLGVFTAQFDGDIGLGRDLFQRSGYGYDLLHKGDLQMAGQGQAARPGNDRMDGNISQLFPGFHDQKAQGPADIRVVAAVVREHEVQAGIQNGDLDGRRTDIDSKCIIF